MDAVTRVSHIYDSASTGPDLIKVSKKKKKGGGSLLCVRLGIK